MCSLHSISMDTMAASMPPSYASVVKYPLVTRTEVSKYVEIPAPAPIPKVCQEEQWNPPPFDYYGLHHYVARLASKVASLMREIEAGWIAELKETNRKARVGRLEHQFLTIFDLGQELGKQTNGKYWILNKVVQLSPDSKFLAYLGNQVIRDHICSFLESYYSVHLSGADNDVVKICKLRSGIEFFFTMFEGSYTKGSAVDKTMESLHNVYDAIGTEFGFWYESEGRRMHGSPPPHMPATHTWWKWAVEEE